MLEVNQSNPILQRWPIFSLPKQIYSQTTSCSQEEELALIEEVTR